MIKFFTIYNLIQHNLNIQIFKNEKKISIFILEYLLLKRTNLFQGLLSEKKN